MRFAGRSPLNWTPEGLPKPGQGIKTCSIGLAGTQVPASPSKGVPGSWKVGLLPALISSNCVMLIVWTLFAIQRAVHTAVNWATRSYDPLSRRLPINFTCWDYSATLRQSRPPGGCYGVHIHHSTGQRVQRGQRGQRERVVPVPATRGAPLGSLNDAVLYRWHLRGIYCLWIDWVSPHTVKNQVWLSLCLSPSVCPSVSV